MSSYQSHQLSVRLTLSSERSVWACTWTLLPRKPCGPWARVRDCLTEKWRQTGFRWSWSLLISWMIQQDPRRLSGEASQERGAWALSASSSHRPRDGRVSPALAGGVPTNQSLCCVWNFFPADNFEMDVSEWSHREHFFTLGDIPRNMCVPFRVLPGASGFCFSGPVQPLMAPAENRRARLSAAASAAPHQVFGLR